MSEEEAKRKHNFCTLLLASDNTVRTYTLYFKPPIWTRKLIALETNLIEIQKKKPGWALGAKDGEGAWDKDQSCWVDDNNWPKLKDHNFNIKEDIQCTEKF